MSDIIKQTDFTLVLSGGSTNVIANNSIGGNPSSESVSDEVGNLFGDLTTEQLSAGTEDYRCIYIFNDGDAVAYSVTVFIVSEITGGSEIFIGIPNPTNEIQRINITNGTLVTGGFFNISYNGFSIQTAWDADEFVWSQNLKNSLMSLSDIDSVVVTPIISANDIIFEINFNGLGSNKSHDLLEITQNGLTGVSTDFIISRVFSGSPINTIAAEIGFSTNPPGNVTFSKATSETPIEVGTLLSGEGFPLWFKRATAAGVEYSLDNTIISLNCDPVLF